jgi:hypothetical protein
MEADAAEQSITKNKITGYFGCKQKTDVINILTPIKLPSTTCTEQEQTQSPMNKSSAIQVQVQSQTRKCLSARRRVNDVLKEHHPEVGRIANPSPKLRQSGAKSIISGKKRERVGGCESPAKRNKLEFRKLLNFCDGQANEGDSTFKPNMLKERHPSVNRNTDTSSALSGPESANCEGRRK